MGRFINADSLASTGQGIIGNNMFAYCLNNPVQHSDSAGSYARTVNPNANCYEAHPAGVGGGIPIGIPIGIGSIVDQLWDVASKSYARSSSRKYRTPEEVHHLVAKEAWNARPAAAILNETLPDGVENPLNKISIKTGLHRRLHTKIYYGIANAIVIGAYHAGDDPESKQQNVAIALTALWVIVYQLNSMSPY